jgi:hypothetical protein
MILRLRCDCGRNLADITRPTFPDGTPTNPDFTWSGLTLRRRPNVTGSDYRPAPVSRSRTYTLNCRCGHTWQLTAERVETAWQNTQHRARRVVIAALGVDV